MFASDGEDQHYHPIGNLDNLMHNVEDELHLAIGRPIQVPIGSDYDTESPIRNDYDSDRRTYLNSDSESFSDTDDYHIHRFPPYSDDRYSDHYSSDENRSVKRSILRHRFGQRRRKRCKSFGSHERDQISNLPDSILHQILSSVDTKLVVRSSVIAKRWKFLWREVPCLNFYSPRSKGSSKEMNVRRKKNFVLFVDRVLLLRDENTNIEKFSLSASDLSHLEDWMVVARRKHVQEFHLEINQKRYRMLPDFIFSMDIQVLKITCPDHVLVTPVYMRVAPYLRTIELSSFTLRSGKGNKELNLKCPSLENLKMSNCDHRNIRILQISAPRLKTLVLENRSSDNTSHCHLKIFTPDLLSVVLKGTTYKEYCFTNLESLVNAKFDLEEHSVEAQILYQVLNGFSSVRNLLLSGLKLKSAEESSDMLENFLKPFLSLRCARLIGFTDGSCGGPICDLLEGSHLVEGLVLGINQFPTYKEWAGLHKCFSRLKWIEIHGVTGKEEELEVLKFVSEAAVLLEDFTVKADEKFSLKTRREQASFSFKIHSLPKSSSTVEILFLV